MKTGFKMVEARGIEPRSEDIQHPASTCLVVVLILHCHTPNDRIMIVPVWLRFRHPFPKHERRLAYFIDTRHASQAKDILSAGCFLPRLCMTSLLTQPLPVQACYIRLQLCYTVFYECRRLDMPLKPQLTPSKPCRPLLSNQ